MHIFKKEENRRKEQKNAKHLGVSATATGKKQKQERNKKKTSY